MSGGYIRDGQTWRLPSGRLLALTEGIGFLKQQYALRHPKEDPGKVVLYPRSSFMTDDDLTSRISNSGQFRHIIRSLHLARPCRSVSSQEGDRCLEGSWVVAKDGDETLAGKIVRIFLHDKHSYVMLEKFEFGVAEPRFQLPVLSVPSGRPVFLLRGTQVQYDFNVQEVGGQFLVNLFSLHNQDLLYRTVPAALLNMRPRFLHRRDLHQQASRQLRLADGPRR